jgi:uncharacterized protein YfbU (UPF0304 family)
MKLSPETRWILANQYRLLEQSASEGPRSEYRNAVTILEDGYELEYETLTQTFLKPTSEEECREVYDILDMYRDLRFAYENLGSTSGVEEAAVSFRGFDGNNEPKALLYARFLIKDLGKWEELAPALGFGLNSQTPMLDRYRRMLEVWRQCRSDRDQLALEPPAGSLLTAEEIKRIVEAR